MLLLQTSNQVPLESAVTFERLFGRQAGSSVYRFVDFITMNQQVGRRLPRAITGGSLNYGSVYPSPGKG
jgi:hypothetical protein